jgi:N-acetylglutamate synthase
MPDIAQLEYVAANALPASVTEHLDGWRLRYSYGVTRRANSVLAEKREGSLEPKLEAVESFYNRFGVKPRYQLCPASEPSGLNRILLAKDYTNIPGAKVQTLVLKNFKPDTNIAKVQLLDKPNNAWFSIYRAVEKAEAHKEKVRTWMLENVQPAAAFALLYLDDQPAAVGLGVFEAGYIGMFNMATLPECRGRGGASTILAALAAWGKELNGHTLYLQVAEENAVAQKVYENLGFKTLYSYWYLEAPKTKE